MNMKHAGRLGAALFILLLSGVLQAEEMLKPFILAGKVRGELAAMANQTVQKLTSNGFEVVGNYSPYEDAIVIVVTNNTLKKNAAQSEAGAYGAIQRVSVTKVGDTLQIAYTNPVYMANAYRMQGDLSAVATALNKALGKEAAYGSENGLSAAKLRDYHYKWLMPYFDDPLSLAEYDSYEAALKGVEAGLAAAKGGVKKVYRVDVPGKQTSVFGVQMAGPQDNDCSGDKYIMERIDFKDIKSTPHLSYEMVVLGKKVYALPAEFRIAISFPDLSMMGSNSFASIMCAPSSIEEALTLAAGGKLE